MSPPGLLPLPRAPKPAPSVVLPGDEGLFRYLRCTITAFRGAIGASAAHIRFKVGSNEYPLHPLTGDETPVPYVASASASYSSSYAPWRAFDSNPGTDPFDFSWYTGMVSPPAWIQLDLGSGNRITPTGLVVINDNPEAGWSSFRVEGSTSSAFLGEQSLLFETSGVVWFPDEIKIFLF